MGSSILELLKPKDEIEFAVLYMGIYEWNLTLRSPASWYSYGTHGNDNRSLFFDCLHGGSWLVKPKM